MKPFNIQFQEYKQTISGLSSLAEESFLYWLHNYVNQKDQFNPFNFITGKIYSFEYVDKLEKGKKFINKRPLVFFTKFTNPQKIAFSGIDLILMPPMVRLAFLTRIQGVYHDQIETNLKKIQNGDLLSQIQLRVEYENMDAIMKGIPFKNTYRVWDLKKVSDINEIPYEAWPKIVYLHTRSIEGSQIEEIYNKNSQI